MSTAMNTVKTVTVKTVQKFKDEGKKFSMLTAYDYSTAKYIDEAGVDMILVGDSLAMTALGYDSTHGVGIEEMKIFTKAVARGVKRTMVIADMPFLSYHTDIPAAIKNGGELIRCGAKGVKIEGGGEYINELVKRLTESGIPVVGHLGFTPQFMHTLGGYRVQGKTDEAVEQILTSAKALEKAGAFALVLEMVPELGAQYITENLQIPTISCGAGRFCTGQVLVCDDVFGKYSDMTPKFARKYGDMKSFIIDCAKRYDADVKSGAFPSVNEVF